MSSPANREAGDGAILFAAKGISKEYEGNEVLQEISLDIREGEVVGLVGENGAGKSTMLKIIMGAEAPSRGSMTVRDSAYSPKNPREAAAQGVGMVYQEQSLIVNLTVGQNIFFGGEKAYAKGGFVDWKRMYADTSKVLSEAGIEGIAPGDIVGELDFADRQMVEIAKVLHALKISGHDRALILLDEPTSVLSEAEVAKLFGRVRHLRGEGNSVVFVSHRLDEVLEVCDRVFVLKDGRNVGEMPTAEADEERLYELMVGQSSSGEYYREEEQAEPGDKVVLEARGLGLRGLFKDINFELRAGEILGICGLVGSGKEDLCSVLCGDERPTSGSLVANGRTLRFRSPRDAARKGILSVPKERSVEGILGNLSVGENVGLSSLRRLRRFGLVSKRAQSDMATSWISRLEIRCSGPDEPLIELSGGNAQKVVISRVLASGSKVLVFNHPTRGVDVGAKEDIYALIRKVASQGLSVILLGDSLDECIGLSNRVLVMKDGLVTKAFDASPGRKPAKIDIVKHMM